MKEKLTIQIADIPLSVITDESEELVRATVSLLDARMRSLLSTHKNCSKLNASLLCALDFLGEKLKAEKKIRNLEAQVSLYEANLRRLREEAATPATPAVEASKEVGVETDAEADAVPAKEEPTTAAVPSAAQEAETPKETPAETPAAEAPSVAERVPAPAVEEKAEAAPETPSLREDKLRHIEELLRRRQESDKPEAADATPQNASRNEKLREIEELLRGGSKSLSEALKDAIRS